MRTPHQDVLPKELLLIHEVKHQHPRTDQPPSDVLAITARIRDRLTLHARRRTSLFGDQNLQGSFLVLRHSGYGSVRETWKYFSTINPQHYELTSQFCLGLSWPGTIRLLYHFNSEFKKHKGYCLVGCLWSSFFLTECSVSGVANRAEQCSKGVYRAAPSEPAPEIWSEFDVCKPFI